MKKSGFWAFSIQIITVVSYLSGVHVKLLFGLSPEIAVLHVTLERQDVLKFDIFYLITKEA